MKLVGTRSQFLNDRLYDASGTVTNGTTVQLVLPMRKSCTLLLLQNTSAGSLLFEFGPARATATLTTGAVSSMTITNAGFGYTYPPLVQFLGGGGTPPGNTADVAAGLPDYPSPAWPTPNRPAMAHAVLVGGAINSFVIDDPGAGYLTAPYVNIYNDPRDPKGAALPSATVGLLLPTASAPVIFDKSAVPTDQVSVYGATTGQAFVCKWMN